MFSRRRFLVLSASLSAVACTSSDPVDSGPGSTDSGQPHHPPALALSKHPWVQLLGPGRARLRFETREARALPVTLLLPDGSTASATPVLREDELAYEWDFGLDDVLPDTPGLHVVQEVVFEDLEPGQLYAWQVELGADDAGTVQVVSGSFRAPVAAGQPFRLGWLADTMTPKNAVTAATLAAAAPDLVLHGGDLVYQSSPTDTWNGLYAALEPLLATAATVYAVGNHEFEEMDEIHEMFDRLLSPQGDAAGPRWFSVDCGSLRFLVMDSESRREDLEQDDEGQWEWVQAQLAEVAASSTLAHAVVAMHRPMFTGSKYWVNDPTERDARHAAFRDAGVKLVLCGHAHCYEHWVVDGVHYIVDGGGGALTYDPNEGMKELTAARPEEAKLRLMANRTNGCTVVDVAADGSLEIQRLDENGAVEDSFSVGVT